MAKAPQGRLGRRADAGKPAGDGGVTETGLPAKPAADPRPAQQPGRRRFRTFRAISALILREIGTRDSQTSLGFLWSIIDPVATVAILTVAFALIMRNPPLGTSFALFYVTGVGLFHIYSQLARTVAVSIRYSRQLLGFPAVTVIDAILARFLLQFTVNFIVFVILVWGVIQFNGLRVNLDIGAFLLALSMAAVLGLGLGALNSVLFMLLPTYEMLWGMLTRPMAIASGVLILIEDLPDWLFNILWWNPGAHFVAMMRRAIYPFYDTSWVSPLYVFLVAAVALSFGLVTLHRWVYDALER